jgi:hypothetical protein
LDEPYAHVFFDTRCCSGLFGPGLRTGRYFAIFLSLLMLAGLWVLTNRIGGRWWAAAAVGAVALNPALIKTYSVGLSQGLIACMLVWIVVLILGERRSTVHIMLGALLTGLMVTTREEIVVVYRRAPIHLLALWARMASWQLLQVYRL